MNFNASVLNQITVSIFPNPTNSKVLLAIDNHDFVENKIHLEIFNSLGKLIYKTSLSRNQEVNELDLSNQPKGIYLLKVCYENKSNSYKIIKE